MPCPFDTKPRWERRKEARPQELLEAAIDLFVERGYAATRLEDVARRAGVSKGTLYLYYENKEELFKAVVRSSIVPAIGEAEVSVAEFDGHSADLLRHLIHNQTVTIDGDIAYGETVATAEHVVPQAEGEALLCWAIRYQDVWRHEADAWRFTRRELVVDWQELRPLAPTGAL